MRHRSFVLLLAGLMLVAAACGDGSTGDGDSAATTTVVEAMDDGAMDDMGDQDMDDMDGNEGDHDDDGDHRDHDHGETVEAESDISVSINITEGGDGYVVAITTTGFTFDESAVDSDHVDGVGHAHIYLDGEKLGRVFSDSYVLGALEPGEHQVRVELNSNDHRPYTSGGLAIQDIATVVVDGGSEADVVIDVTVAADGTVTGEDRYEAAIGDVVTIRVASEVGEELHLHGYDLFAELVPGETAELTFTADVPGIFEAELEGSGVEVLKLEVS